MVTIGLQPYSADTVAVSRSPLGVTPRSKPALSPPRLASTPKPPVSPATTTINCNTLHPLSNATRVARSLTYNNTTTISNITIPLNTSIGGDAATPATTTAYQRQERLPSGALAIYSVQVLFLVSHLCTVFLFL